jgi:5-methylcytosine-specific restriction enzyme A
MPTKPKRPCNQAGCPALVSDGAYCEKHQKAKTTRDRRRYDSTPGRKEQKRFYSSDAWRRLRRMKLHESVLCEFEGCNEVAVLVHHTKPERDFKEDRLELSSLMSLCNKHHEEIHKAGRWGK